MSWGPKEAENPRRGRRHDELKFTYKSKKEKTNKSPSHLPFCHFVSIEQSLTLFLNSFFCVIQIYMRKFEPL